MKFKIREGFVVHLEKILDVGGARTTVTQPIFAGETADFTPEQAADHLHKLEPLDKDASKFADAAVVDVPTPAAAPVDQAALAAAIAATLAAMGIKAPDQASAKP